MEAELDPVASGLVHHACVITQQKPTPKFEHASLVGSMPQVPSCLKVSGVIHLRQGKLCIWDPPRPTAGVSSDLYPFATMNYDFKTVYSVSTVNFSPGEGA